MDYTKFYSKIAIRESHNLIRMITSRYIQNPSGVLFFAGGLPNSETFPFKRISYSCNNSADNQLDDFELFSALQYGKTQGFAPLLEKWRELQKKWHSPKYDNWCLQFTTGSMEGCSSLIKILINEDEPIMVQSPTYTGIIECLTVQKADIILINMDDDGALVNDIVKVCEERLKNRQPLPKVLYLNPTGANPSGIVYTNKRKAEIYELASRYDFLIMEDDAYFFIHFLEKQPTSFLSMDVEGRVLRIDSFSKIMSAGLRLGVVTAPQPIIEKLTEYITRNTLHCSSLSQVLVYKLLKNWSDEELNAHFVQLQNFYRNKRDIMLKSINKHLTGIATYSVPRGGMFVWLKINGLEDVKDLVMNKCMQNGVYVLPGHAFYTDDNQPCSYIRISYSQMNAADVDKGIFKLASIIREAVTQEQVYHETKNNKM